MSDRCSRGLQQLRLALCAMLVIAAAGCSPQPPGAVKNPGAQAVDVVSVAATTQPLGIEIEAVGTARANESVEVTSQDFEHGYRHPLQGRRPRRKGSVLVEIDSAEVRASLAEAEAALAESQNQFKRSRDLYTQQGLVRSQLDQIEATLKANQARVDAAKARLADTIIRATLRRPHRLSVTSASAAW